MRRDSEDSDGDGHESWGGDPERTNSPGFAGSWRRVQPRFDDPMSWSLTLMRAAGIDVRLHVFFLLFAALMLLRAAFPAAHAETARLSLGVTTLLLGALFIVILLHEFGHCVACRRCGGIADDILMWPLGGLASCAPPQDWRAHFWTALGGPLVNVLIVCFTAPTLRVLTGSWAIAMPSLYPDDIYTVNENWWMMALFAINWVALGTLIFNLIPLFPFDGGRLLQALLWSRFGYARAMRFAVRVGYFGAIFLGLFGLVTESILLVCLALFGGLTCRATVKELDFTEEALGFEDSAGGVYSESLETSKRALDAERIEDERRRGRDAARRASGIAKRASEEAEFDRILDKIRTSGLGSLTASERRILESETERRRREGR